MSKIAFNSVVISGNPAIDWSGAASGNGVLVAVSDGLDPDYDPTDFVYISTDGGSSWSPQALPEANDWARIIFTGTSFLCFTFNGELCARSLDGVNWTVADMGAYQLAQNPCVGNGVIIAVTDGGVANELRIARSYDDGLTWTTDTFTLSDDFNYKSALAFDGTQFLSVGYSGTASTGRGATCYSTDNGDSWTVTHSVLADEDWQPGTMLWNGEKFFIAQSNSDVFAASSDGVTWTYSILPESNYWHFARVSNETIFVVAPNDGTVAYSDDGTLWALAESGMAAYGGCVDEDGNLFLVGAANTPEAAYSYSIAFWTGKLSCVES